MTRHAVDLELGPALELVLAALPIVAIVVLLILRVAALHAVLACIALTLALFPWFPIAGQALLERAQSLSVAALSAVFIMLGGIWLSEMLAAAGAQERISAWLSGAAQTHDRTVLLLGLGIAPLAESIIGYGVGLITTVPLLMRIGLTATKAATIGLLGLVVAPWGSMGPALLISAGMSGLPLRDIGVWTAVLDLPVLIVMGVAMAFVGLGGRRGSRMLGEVLVVTLLMWLALLAVDLWVTPLLGGVVASVVGIAAFIALAGIRGSRAHRMDRGTARAFTPYGALIAALVLATVLGMVLDLGAWHALITSPGLWIMVVASATPLILRMPRSTASIAVRRGTRMWLPICSVTLLFIGFGALLSVNGMSAALAAGAASLGGAFLVLVPAIGALSGYVTNSGSASSAIAAVPITDAAHALGANPAIALGALNVSAAMAIMLCPARLVIAEGVANGIAAARGHAGSSGIVHTDTGPVDTAPLDLDRVEVGRVVRVVLLANLLVLAILTPAVAALLL